MNRLSVFTAACVASLALAGSARAELLVNGDFEAQPNFNAGVGGDGSYTLFIDNQMPGWTIRPDYGVTVHNHGYSFISGTYSVNLDGEGYHGHNADFSQSFNTILGQPYQLSYDFKAWQNASQRLLVSLNDAALNPTDAAAGRIYDGNQVVGSTDVTTTTVLFLGTGNPITLRVTELQTGVNDNAIIVDNFSVNAIPEPTTAAFALPALALLRRRR